MIDLNDILTIEIQWEGPLTLKEVELKKTDVDFGIYMAFGRHNLYGEHTLLYVGKAEQQKFGVRILQHLDDDWWGNEIIYLGRIGSYIKLTHDNFNFWDEQIDYAETMFIKYCLPSWNSSKINSARRRYSFENAIIINDGQLTKATPRVMCDWLFEYSSLKNKSWKPYSNL